MEKSLNFCLGINITQIIFIFMKIHITMCSAFYETPLSAQTGLPSMVLIQWPEVRTQSSSPNFLGFHCVRSGTNSAPVLSDEEDTLKSWLN